VVTHFGLSRGERREQAARLVARIAECPATLSVLVGDFNEWFVGSALLGRLRAALGREVAVPSFPAPLPLFALDRIWIRPGSALERVTAHRSRTARVASDHLPVVADVRLP
jgi:endonuclease/exonuclease/phosphatase family metal-dependent hydrolase